MNYLKTFEAFKSVKKTGKIKRHWRKGRGGVTTVMGNISDKDAEIAELKRQLAESTKTTAPIVNEKVSEDLEEEKAEKERLKTHQRLRNQPLGCGALDV